MTPKPLLHARTAQTIDTLLSNPPHALLINGAPGVGKATVACWIAEQLLNAPLTNHPYVLQIHAENGKAIGIESIRELEKMTTLKVPNEGSINRVLIIHDATQLTTEAQNALLKTLEEPPIDTIIILTVTQSEALLPTIQSRAQILTLTPPPASDVAHAILQLPSVSDEQTTRIMALSGGLPGLAFALAEDAQDHPLVAAATMARSLLTESSFVRLCKVDALAKDKQATSDVLYMLMQMSRAALLSSKSKRWEQVLRAAYETDVSLRQGAQTKLALTNLMLTL